VVNVEGSDRGSAFSRFCDSASVRFTFAGLRSLLRLAFGELADEDGVTGSFFKDLLGGVWLASLRPELVVSLMAFICGAYQF
jgi:hypothetical protein